MMDRMEFMDIHNEISRYLASAKKVSTNELNAALVEYAKTGEQHSLDTIIMGCALLITHRAKYYGNDIISDSDLISVGIRGVEHAARSFDSSKGAKFTTYALFWINARMQREILKLKSVVTVSATNWNLSIKLKKLRKLGHTDDEIIKSTNISADSINNVRTVFDDVSLDAILENQLSSSDIDILMDERPNPYDILEKADDERLINIRINQLHHKIRNMMELRFGIHVDADMTLREIGKIHNLTAERVRQMLTETLKSIRDSLS
jgi:RNA polymerase primary sigma factor